MRTATTLTFVLTCLALTACPGRADRPADDDARWVPLDISASMNYDAVCTPNEMLLCGRSYLSDRQDGDTDGDLRANPIEQHHYPHMLFGQHRMGRHWMSLSFAVGGATYPDGRGRAQQTTIPPDGGIPPTGRAGIYQLYMDELEHPDWAISTRAGPKRGRNAIQFRVPAREDARMTIPLPEPQRRRYRAINLLFAGTTHGLAMRNRVRLSARYADGTLATLWEGRMGDVRGNAVVGWNKVEHRTRDGQREGLDMGYSIDASSYAVVVRRPGRWGGDVAMIEFDRPLALDPARTLDALVVERADPERETSWRVFFFAVSALAAE